jgi:hypothetical protein
MTKNIIICLLSIALIAVGFTYFNQSKNPPMATSANITLNTYTTSNLSFDYPSDLNVSTDRGSINIKDNNADSGFDLRPGEMWITISPTTKSDFDSETELMQMESYASHSFSARDLVEVNNNYFRMEMIIGAGQSATAAQIESYNTIKESISN